jgi:N-acetylglucosamine kinase-like BadF-type ATPase
MILVADSGSTKADWVLLGENNFQKQLSTVGFNPYFHDETFILSALESNEEMKSCANDVQKIYFYGAGCSSVERNEKVRLALSKFFKKAIIEVDSDILASVRASCGDEAGISCILGTGSNSSYFDGEKVHKNNYGLGFIMGDEGSGTYLGKKLITHYLYNILPMDLRTEFEKQYEMNKEIMIKNVYNNPGANVWLASFAKFMVENKDHVWVKSIARKGIDEFFDLYVISYPNYKSIPTNFVGSIAYYFSDLIAEVSKEKQVRLGKIVRQPIQGLAEYFAGKKSNPA